MQFKEKKCMNYVNFKILNKTKAQYLTSNFIATYDNISYFRR